MSDDLETRIDGDPAGIEAIGQWLRVTLRDATTTYAETVLAARRDAEAAWDGDTSESFRARLTTLTGGVDTVTDIAGTQGASVDTLAVDLRTAQAETERARQIALDGGLGVDGTLVRNPGDGPPRPIPPSADAPAYLIAGYNLAVADFDAHQTLIDYWNMVVKIVQDALAAWEAALARASDSWLSGGGNLATLAQGFLVGGANGISVATQRFAYQAQTALHADNVRATAGHIDALTNPDGSTRAPAQWMNEFLDRVDAESAARSAAESAANEKIKPSGSAVKILNGLGYVVTGYAVVDDWVNGGESLPQAVTSNVGGLLGGIAAGAAAGGIAGTVVPVAGNVVRAVVGGVVGGAASIVTSGTIDSVWENGWAWGAFGDGFGELSDTVGTTVSWPGQAWKALFD